MRPGINIYFFIGVTGELIKHAPIIKELQKRRVPFKIITSGQGKVNFKELNGYIGTLSPDIIFPEKTNKSSALMFILWAIKTLVYAPVLLKKEISTLKKRDTYFFIQGDTVSSSIGAIVAKLFYGIKLIHIESGDLSRNLFEPFPEEICRHINMRLGDVLCAPNGWAKNNLERARGVKLNTIHNTLIESYKWAIRNSKVPVEITKLKKYYYLYMHRQEHVIFRKNYSKIIMEFVIKNADSGLNCVLLNSPLTTSVVDSLSKTWDKKTRQKIIISQPFSYINFMKLLSNAEFLATDSATNQLESTFIGKPFLSLRTHVEQIEGLNENVVIAKDDENIIKGFLKSYKKYKRKPKQFKNSPSKIIVDYLVDHEWS